VAEREVLTDLTDNNLSPTKYNALEKDIAVINVYFGKPTTIGN
jgi:hypothetical protein